MTTYTDLLREHGVEYRLPEQHHHATLGRIQTDCPFCSPGWQNFRLGFHVKRRSFSCWCCGPHRTAETLSKLLDVPEDEAFRIAKTILGADDDSNPILIAQAKRGTLVLPPNVGKMTATHRGYLRWRGFDPEEVERLHGLKGIGVCDWHYLSWRLFIPIHDYKGELVSWTTRAVAKANVGRKRYLSAKPGQEKVSHKHVLGGEQLVSPHDPIVVCEGPLDGMAIGPGACWLTGMIWSMQQVWRVVQHPVRVVCFDNEAQAQRKADELCRMLEPFEGQTIRVRLESAKDPADALLSAAGRRELAEFRKRYLEDRYEVAVG